MKAQLRKTLDKLKADVAEQLKLVHELELALEIDDLIPNIYKDEGGVSLNVEPMTYNRGILAHRKKCVVYINEHKFMGNQISDVIWAHFSKNDQYYCPKKK